MRNFLMQLNFDFFSLLSEILGNMVAVIPRFLSAIVILIIGSICSKLITKSVRALLERTGIDRISQKLEEIDIVKKSKLKFFPSKIISKTLHYLLILIIIIVVTDVLKVEILSNLIKDFFQFIPRMITGVIILIFGLIFSESMRKILLTTLKSLNISGAKIVASFVFYFLLVNILMVALRQSGIETESLSQNISILLGGIVLAFGLGYGIASKDIFANVLSSYYYKDKFELGQKVTIGEEKGIIDDITRNNIILKNEKGDLVYIPIHRLTRDNIIVHE